MAKELFYRFIVGGVVVAFFSMVGTVWKPRTFAGLFGAAPSVAITTLGLAFAMHPRAHVVTLARSMLIATPALLAYCRICVEVARRPHVSVRLGTVLAWGAWALAVLVCWALFDGRLNDV
jgi:uncharacterized membrane protein (GlpM family)